MPTEKRRLFLTILDPDVVRTLGLEPAAPDQFGAAQAWGALARYAGLLNRAGRELEQVLDHQEWRYLADALNGCADLWDYDGPPIPGLTLILAEAADAHLLNRAGDRRFDSDPDGRVTALIGKLQSLTPTHGDAILAAVRWFWGHTELGADSEWWRVAARTGPARES